MLLIRIYTLTFRLLVVKGSDLCKFRASGALVLSGSSMLQNEGNESLQRRGFFKYYRISELRLNR